MREHFQHLDTIPEQKLLDGIYAKMVHMAGTSVAHVRLEKGAVLPSPSHERRYDECASDVQIRRYAADESFQRRRLGEP